MSFCRVFICPETVDLYLTQGKPLLWLTPVIVNLLASLIWVFMSLVDPWRSGMKAISSLCLTTSFHPDNKAKVTLCWQEAAWKRTIGPESQQKMCKYTCLPLLVSSTYITCFFPTQKPKRHMYYCLVSTPAFAFFHHKPSSKWWSYQVETMVGGSGGDASSSYFEEWDR